MTKTSNELRVGDVIVPNQIRYPILVLDKAHIANQDFFIRAVKHPELKIWYSEVDLEPNEFPKEASSRHTTGIVVFVPRLLNVGEGVLVERVFSTGRSGRGRPVELPPNVIGPQDRMLRELFVPTQAPATAPATSPALAQLPDGVLVERRRT